MNYLNPHCKEWDEESMEILFTDITEKKKKSRHSRFPSLGKSIKKRLSSRRMNDSDEDTDLEETQYAGKVVVKRCVTTQELYEAACSKYQLLPCTAFLDLLDNNQLAADLSYKSLDSADIKAVAVALAKDERLEELDVSFNKFDKEGIKYLEDAFYQNMRIKKLNISGNHLGIEGAISVGEILRHNDMLHSLDASGCQFVERDVFYIACGLQVNNTLSELNLSHNEIMEEGGILLGRAIKATRSLQVLNLSWNHLRLKGAQAVAFGLEDNESITHLDLSWNGFGDAGIAVLSEALQDNRTLTFLDISCNRISPNGASKLGKMLSVNEALDEIRIAHNPITSEGAQTIVKCILDNEESSLHVLDIQGVNVTHDILIQVSSIHTRQSFQFRHGEFVRTPDPFGQRSLSDVHQRIDPFNLFMVYIENEGLRVCDLFRQLDKDGDLRLSPEEIKHGFQLLDVPIGADKLDDLIARLDLNNDGEIDFTELLANCKDFRVKQLMDKIKAKREQKVVGELRKQMKESLLTPDMSSLKPQIFSRPSSARLNTKDGVAVEVIPANRKSPSNKEYEVTTMHTAGPDPLPPVEAPDQL